MMAAGMGSLPEQQGHYPECLMVAGALNMVHDEDL